MAARWGGRRPVAFFTWFVVTGHFLLAPGRLGHGLTFFQRLFPHLGFWPRLTLVWRQYHNFSQIFIDRLLIDTTHPPQFTSSGWHHLNHALQRGNGAVMIMSHAGNWEMAASFFKQRAPQTQLMLMMGRRATERLEAKQKQALAAQGVRIAAEGPDRSAAMAMIPAIRWLQAGGVVAMTGDTCRHPRQRSLAIPFLGKPAQFPAAPWALAMLSNTPVLFFFTNRHTNGSYHFSFHKPILVQPTHRHLRTNAMLTAAAQYVSCLEAHVRRHPDQWFHFEPIWDPPKGKHDDSE